MTYQPTSYDTYKERLQNKTIGIWGFGATGQSVLRFLSNYATHFYIFDTAPLTTEQLTLIESYRNRKTQQCTITIVQPDLLTEFLAACQTIVPSPGIDITPHLEAYPHLFVSELDIFAAYATTPYLAITGSVGKTTTTHLLQQFLSLLKLRVQAIGNIGMPVLDALADQSNYDYFIIETSSFQLEHTTLFKPTIATIINITQNHLDRHHTMENYLRAKGKILAHQTDEDIAILPMEYTDNFWPLLRNQKVQWVSQHAYDDITSLEPLAQLTCKSNLVLILAIIENLNFDLDQLPALARHITRPEHRMEYVRTWNSIIFYNDSKSTTPASTCYALEQSFGKPTILLLGGLSKGIDRQPLIKQLKKFKHLTYIICFGAESTQLHEWCQKIKLQSIATTTLETALEAALSVAKSGDLILLSPSGSSFDLFKNFIERGNRFKALVHALQ